MQDYETLNKYQELETKITDLYYVMYYGDILNENYSFIAPCSEINDLDQFQ